MKKFMGAFTMVAATFASQQGVAAAVPDTDNAGGTEVTPSANGDLAKPITVIKGGAIFKLALPRSKGVESLMAEHYSHSSHSSHSSHYSGR